MEQIKTTDRPLKSPKGGPQKIFMNVKSVGSSSLVFVTIFDIYGRIQIQTPQSNNATTTKLATTFATNGSIYSMSQVR